MKIMFMGTPDFAAVSLQALLDAGHQVVAAVSQPDKPQGRKRQILPTPVKQTAEAAGIPVLQPETLRGEAFLPALQTYQPDVIVVVAYGRLLPPYILEFPKLGCINVHGSLLPKYRGAAPIQWSIINGEETTGVTTMYMAEGLDTGDMLLKKETPILPEDTAETLFDRLAVLGGQVLCETLAALPTIEPVPQKDEESCYAPMLTKETGAIDWSQPARTVWNLVRGTNPWPVAYSAYEGKKFKIFACEVTEAGGPAGTILAASQKDGLVIACGEGAVRVLKVQFEGAKQMTPEAYFAGHTMAVGTRL